MFLTFDTETTGLPKSWRAHPSEVENWPRVVQLAWEFYDLCGRKVLGRCDLIKPVGFAIPRDAQAVHGISTAVATSKGVPIAEALDAFMKPLSVASVVVAHNLNFDASVLGAEFYRTRREDPFPGKPQVCTMVASTRYCALPGPYGAKWPKLPELHSVLFGRPIKEAHDAAVDVAGCSKCFAELRRLGIVTVPTLDATTCADCRRGLDDLGVVCKSTRGA